MCVAEWHLVCAKRRGKNGKATWHGALHDCYQHQVKTQLHDKYQLFFSGLEQSASLWMCTSETGQ